MFLNTLDRRIIIENGFKYGRPHYFWEKDYGESDYEKLKFEMEYKRFIAGYKIRNYFRENKNGRHK